jgi:hypothetical protein
VVGLLAVRNTTLYEGLVASRARLCFSSDNTVNQIMGRYGNQTALDNTARTTFNTDSRAILPNTLGTIDVASVLESSLNSRKWVVTPTPPYTNQNPVENPAVHPDSAGYLLVQNSGIFPALTYP